MNTLPMLGARDGQAGLAPVGLIGGLTWRSTLLYYERLNRAFEQHCGGHSSARVIVASLDYASLLRVANTAGWDQVERVIVDTGQWLERSGCKVIALAAVTAHLSHAALSGAVTATVPHIFDASRKWLDEARISTVGVLGTGRTCGSAFPRERLSSGASRDVIVASAELQSRIDAMIHERLCVGTISDADRELLLDAVESLRLRGAQAVLLACTELPLLLPFPEAPAVPVVDTVALHVQAICELILKAPNP